MNGTEVQNHQTRNGVSISEESASINITWGTIIFIPAGALIQLTFLQCSLQRQIFLFWQMKLGWEL